MSKVDTLKLELDKFYRENGSFDGLRARNPKLYDRIRHFMKREIGFFPKFLLQCGYDVLYHGLPLERSKENIVEWLLENGRLDKRLDVSNLSLFITRASRVTFKDGDRTVLLMCETCRLVLSADEFNNLLSTKVGKQSKCRNCESAYYQTSDNKRNSNAKWRDNNLERISETNKQYYQNNKVTRLEASRKWYRENADKVKKSGERHYRMNRQKILKRGRIRYAINPQPKLEYGRNHYQNNKEMYKKRYEKRQSILKKLPRESLNKNKLKILQGNICPLTLQSLEDIEYNLDHFIPVSWGNSQEGKFIGGHVFGNCYYLERSLNKSKGNKNPFDWIEEQSEFIRSNFYDILVPFLAERNGLSEEEFANKVKLYWRNYNDGK